MATDVERLIVRLEATQRGFERQLAAASNTADRRARQIESRFRRMNKTLSSGFAGLGSSLTKAFAVAGGIRGFQHLLDASTRMENALKVTGLAGEDLERVYGRLFASAQKNLAPVDALVDLYSRLGLAQSELGVTADQMVDFADRVALALRVQGTTTTEARGALIQLGQAMGEGVVRSQEFNSIIEQAPAIHRAAAAGLKEAGGSVAALRQIMLDGRLSSRAYFDALLAWAEILEDKVKDAQITTTQGMTLIRNEAIKAVGDFAKGSLAAEGLGDAFKQMADAINGVNFEQFGEQVRGLLGMINDIRSAMNWVSQLGVRIGEEFETDRIGDALMGGATHQSYLSGAFTITNQRGVQSRINEAFGNAVDTATTLTEEAIRAAAGTVTAEGKTGRLDASSELSPVSLDDYEVPAGAKGGKGSKGGKSAKERANEYERLSASIADSTAALVAETEVRRGLNPLVNDYGYAVERARAEQDLLNAALAAGIEITPALRQQIAELANQYATATVEAAQLAESQDKARQRAEEMRELGKDVLGGFISDLRSGTSASEALANALDKIASKLLDMALNNLFENAFGGGMFGGGKGGLLGGFLIPGILHKGGVAGKDGYGHGRAISPSAFTGAKRYHRGGVAGLQPGEVPAILQKGEVVLPRGSKFNGSTETVRVVLQDDSGRMANIADQRIQTAAGPIVQISVEQSTRAVRGGLPSMIAEAQSRKM